MVEGHVEKYKADYEILAKAVRISIVNAMNKKHYKVFPKREENAIDPAEKKESLKQLKSKFS